MVVRGGHGELGEAGLWRGGRRGETGLCEREDRWVRSREKKVFEGRA